MNISEIKDETYKQKVLAEADFLLNRAHKMFEKTIEAINSRNQ